MLLLWFVRMREQEGCAEIIPQSPRQLMMRSLQSCRAGHGLAVIVIVVLFLLLLADAEDNEPGSEIERVPCD